MREDEAQQQKQNQQRANKTRLFYIATQRSNFFYLDLGFVCLQFFFRKLMTKKIVTVVFILK